jgi:hypothetical protein
MASTITLPRVLAPARAGERTFYSAMSFAILAAVLVGFSRSFYLHALFPARPVPPEPFFVLHGLVFTTWFVLLAVQTRLVAAGRADLHRVFGTLGAGLAVAMVVTGVHGAALAGARGFVGIPLPGWQFMAVPITEMVLFPTLVGLAIARRRDGEAHKRLMLLASISILTAAVARWPGVQETGNPFLFFGLADLFLVALAVHDRLVRGRLHPVTLWGGLAIVVSGPLRLVLSGTAAWHAVADFLIRHA